MVTPSFEKGARLGDYLIEDAEPWRAPLERYRATHISTGMEVLLCSLRADAVADADKGVFASEVEELCALTHKHLPRFYGGGHTADVLWVASEYTHGLTLRDVMAAEGDIDPMQVIALCRGRWKAARRHRAPRSSGAPASAQGLEEAAIPRGLDELCAG